MFTRDSEAQAAQFRFYDRPLIWVEGVDDVPFFSRMLAGHNVRIEPAGGKPECAKLIKLMVENDHPYVVVTDGDFGMLFKQRSPHRRAQSLPRHSHENFYFRSDLLGQVACQLAKKDLSESYAQRYFEQLSSNIAEQLDELLALELAARISGAGTKVLPRHINILKGGDGPWDISPTKVQEIAESTSESIPAGAVDDARQLINAPHLVKQFHHLVPGHLLFSAIREIVLHDSRRMTGRRINVRNDSLRVNLINLLFSSKLDDDLKRFRRRVLDAVREVRKRRFGRS